uniref:Uncharacterized protein n=1 Tax=Glycine max TaxID=3847 RepID=A0A0R0IY32_SOYBN
MMYTQNKANERQPLIGGEEAASSESECFFWTREIPWLQLVQSIANSSCVYFYGSGTFYLLLKVGSLSTTLHLHPPFALS